MKSTVYVSVIVFLLTLVTACEITGPESTSSGHDGKAAVHVRIGQEDAVPARTVRPPVALTDVGTWETTGGLTIALTPTTDPTLSASAPDVFVDQDVTFTAGSGYSSYKWYVNNEAVSGATTDTYTLAANSTDTHTLAANSRASGVYEVVVIVQTSAGEKRSARCEFVIKDR